MRQKRWKNVTFCADPADWERLQDLCPRQGISHILRQLIKVHLATRTAKADIATTDLNEVKGLSEGC